MHFWIAHVAQATWAIQAGYNENVDLKSTIYSTEKKQKTKQNKNKNSNNEQTNKQT